MIEKNFRYDATLAAPLTVKLKDGRTLRLIFPRESVLLLSISNGSDFRHEVSYAVIDGEPGEVDCQVDENDGVYTVKTEALTVTVWLDPLKVAVTDSLGITRFETLEGCLTQHEGKQRFTRKLSSAEAIYGLGEHGETLNRNPGRYRIWNRDEPIAHPAKQYYCTIPFGITTGDLTEGPHGFFVDNPGEVTFDVGLENPDHLITEWATGDFHLWLFFEKELKDILSVYTEFTGRIERPPLWSLGYQQCRWSYPTEEKVRYVAKNFRERRIPCDVIYLDIHYMDRYRVFTWDREAFPDPDGLITDLAKDGFRTICIVDPGVAIADGYFAWESAKRIGGFFLSTPEGDVIREEVWPGITGHPDFTNDVTRTTWQTWQWQNLLAKGIAGIWNDMNEPAIFGGGMGCKEYNPEAIQQDFGLRRTHGEIHNIYGQMMAKTSSDGQKRYRANERPFTLTRSGWAGIQRYSAVWTGDNASTYSSMNADIALNLNMGMSGVAYVGCDIGGFAHHATPELFLRWMEWGIFQPFCRGHASISSRDQEPWMFGAATERMVKHLLELRYRLLPYLYSCFVEAAETGLPVNRPLILEYPHDVTVNSLSDHFLVGRDILVAPVLESGKLTKAVYIPAGEWIHFWNQSVYTGGKWHLIDAPFGHPPVFIRAGSIIPMQAPRQSTAFLPVDTTMLMVYPASQLSGVLVEDDGQSIRYQDGEESRVFFTGETRGNVLEIIIGPPKGPYRSPRENWEIYVPLLGKVVDRVEVDGKTIAHELMGSTVFCRFEDTKQRRRVAVYYR